ncbi:MAG: hypothetical protein CVV33_02885 [Methanomicrobiales archaeon HGW-Methanomicrobiales-4]|nr:MAG: hypothetical protein CVV33_02885 [Methanomicrobiales archaeon HGW-Methanomicrobiales-4]
MNVFFLTELLISSQQKLCSLGILCSICDLGLNPGHVHKGEESIGIADEIYDPFIEELNNAFP